MVSMGRLEAHTERQWFWKNLLSQYGWARLGIESINLHKRGWRSHTLTVLLILSIPMAWAARCVLSTCVQKAHTPTFGRAVQILSLSDIYIQRNYHCCYRSQSYGVSGTQQESDQTGICASMVASGFARPFPTGVCPTRPLQ